MTFIVGVLGEDAAGKSAITRYLLESNLPAVTVGPSQQLRILLGRLGLPASRDNFQKLANTLIDFYGPDIHARGCAELIRKSEQPIIVYDSVRLRADVDLIRSIPPSILVYVTAPREVRYKRMLGRNEKVGETELSWEEFLKQETDPINAQVAQLGREADYTFLNDTTPADFLRFQEEIRLKCEAALE